MISDKNTNNILLASSFDYFLPTVQSSDPVAVWVLIFDILIC